MRFAVKRLTPSDLGFFEAHFDKANVSGQKSLNLNRKVFIDDLYPNLPDRLAALGGAIRVSLQVNGPGASFPALELSRKITKRGSKNYRLNGEFLSNPKDAVDRFAKLAPGDLALLAFEGSGEPTGVRFYAISAAEPDDAALHAALSSPDGPSMVSFDTEDLAARIAVAPPSHPVHDLFLEADLAQDLEQAAQGDAQAARRLLARPGSRKVSAAQLAAARRRAEEIGSDGEQLIAGHFGRGANGLTAWVWRSAENAICPFDFEIQTAAGAVRVEVKATTNAHGTAFHISMAEIAAAAEAGRYDLYRVSGLGTEGGTLRICEDIGDFARGLLTALAALPPGVRPDGFTVSPDIFEWSPSIDLGWPDDEDE